MSDCGCAPAPGLSGLGGTQRALTPSESADFLFRHPVVTTMVGETQALQQAGLYNYTANRYTWDAWQFPGVIPPWGMQVQDSVYEYVTLFPAADGTMRYSGFQPFNPEINKESYESPSGELDICNAWQSMMGVDICYGLKVAAVVVGAYLLLSASRKK